MGKTDEDCQLYVGDIVSLTEDFVPRMKWHKGKVIKLICGINDKDCSSQLLVYDKQWKNLTIKLSLQLIVSFKIDSLGNTKESRSHYTEPASKNNQPRHDAGKNADMKQKLNDIKCSSLVVPECVDWIIKQSAPFFQCSITYHVALLQLIEVLFEIVFY